MHVWDMFEAARDWFEKQQLQMAVDMSKRVTEERWLQHEVSIRIVERRLASKGLQSQYTCRQQLLINRICVFGGHSHRPFRFEAAGGQLLENIQPSRFQ